MYGEFFFLIGERCMREFLDVFFPYWRDILRRIFEEMRELIFFLGGDT